MPVNIPVRWSDNTPELKQRLKEGLNQIEATRAGADKLVQSLSGDRIIASAHKYAAAISTMKNGVEALTAAEQKRVNVITSKALEKYQLRLEEAPAALRDLAKATVDAGSATDKLARGMSSLGDAWKKSAEAAAQSKRIVEGMGQAGAEAFAKAKKNADDLAASLKKAADEAQASWKRMADGLRSFADGAKTIGVGLTATLTAPILAMGAASFKAFTDFESAFAGVKKTVQGTPEQLAQISVELREMAKVTPVSAAGLANIAEQAGQLGVKREALSAFTKTIVDISSATHLTAEEAGESFAKIANVMKMPQEQFANMGSAVVALGNFGAGTEQEILNMAQRIAAAGATAGMTTPQVLGIANALTSVGINAEAGGTAISKVINRISLDVASGSSDLRTFARVAGMSSEQFATAWRQDAGAAFKDFMQGLSNARAQGGDTLLKMVHDLGFDVNVRLVNAFLSAANAGDKFAESMNLGTKAFNENTELARASGERYKTVANQLLILKNRVNEVAITMGDAFAQAEVDVLKAGMPLVDMIDSLAKGFQTLPEWVRLATLGFLGLAAAIGPVVYILGSVAGAAATLMTSWAGISAAFGAETVSATMIAGMSSVGSATAGAGAAVAGFGATLATLALPVTLIVAAIAGLATEFYFLYTNSETVRDGLASLGTFLKETFIVAWQGLSSALSDVASVINSEFIIEWEAFKRSLPVDILTSLIAGIKDLAVAIGTTLYQAIQKIRESPTSPLGLSLIAEGARAAKQSLHDLAESREMKARLARPGKDIALTPDVDFVGPMEWIGPKEGPGAGKPLGTFAEGAQTLAQRVSALTEEEREHILTLKAEGYSTKQIAAEMHIASDEIAVFLRQEQLAEKSGRRLAAAQRAYAKELAEYNSAAGPGYLGILNKIGNATYEGIAFDHGRIKSTEVLAGVYGVTKTQVEQVIAAETAWIKSQNALQKEMKETEEATEKSIEHSRDTAVAASTAVGKALMGPQKVLHDLMMQQGNVPYSFHSVLTDAQELGHLMPDMAATANRHMDDILNGPKQFKTEVERANEAVALLAKGFTSLGQLGGDVMGPFMKGLGAVVVQYQTARKMTQQKDDQGRPLGGRFGALSVAFNPNASPEQRAAAGVEAVGAGIEGAMNVWAATSSQRTAMGNAGAGAMAGAQAGAAFGPYGIAIGAAAGFVAGLIRGKPEWAKAADEVGRDFGVKIDKALSDQIAKDAQEVFHGDRLAAEFSNLSAIIQQAGGLNADNLDPMTAKLHDVFSLITQGHLTAAQATKILDENFSAFATTATDAYGNLSDNLQEIIALNRTFGTQSKAITEYLKGQGLSAIAAFGTITKGTSTAVAGYDKLKKAVDDATEAQDKLAESGTASTKETLEAAQKLKDALAAQQKGAEEAKQELSDLGIQAVSAYSAAVASGSTETEALAAIAPSLDMLQQAYDDLGLAVDDVALKALLFKNKVLQGDPQLLASVGGLVQEMAALGNMHLLNASNFAAMERTGERTYTRLQAQVEKFGGTTADALAPMQDYLHQAEEQAKKLGIPLDDLTQQMIDQSRELGIWADKGKTATDILIDGITTLVEKVDDLINALRGMPPTVHTEVTVGASVTPTTETDYGGPPQIEPSYAARGGRVTRRGVQYMALGGNVLGFRPLEMNLPVLRHRIPIDFPMPLGTDIVPVMLTPGEGVVTKQGMAGLGDAGLASLNAGGSFNGLQGPSFSRISSGLDQAPSIGAGLHVPSVGGTGRSSSSVSGAVHYHTWAINISAIDATDLREKVEKQLLPMIIEEVEDSRRGVARRLANAIQRAS